jgi:hypothetical protein
LLKWQAAQTVMPWWHRDGRMGSKSVVKSSGSYRQKRAMAKICHFVGQQPKNRLDLRRAFD